MTTTGQLALGAVQIISSATQELIGYAYTEATPKGQMQRWLLYNEPHNAFEIQPPSSSMAGWSLGDWKASVSHLWKPGSFYVRAKADVYRHGETYGGVTWAQIPPASKLPDPSFPESTDDSHQLDPIGCKLTRVSQEEHTGLVYTLDGLLKPTSTEYWLLPPSYKAAGASSAAKIAVASEEASSLEEFVALANQSFGPGCLFVITGCANYSGARSPAIL